MLGFIKVVKTFFTKRGHGDSGIHDPAQETSTSSLRGEEISTGLRETGYEGSVNTENFHFVWITASDFRHSIKREMRGCFIQPGEQRRGDKDFVEDFKK